MKTYKPRQFDKVMANELLDGEDNFDEDFIETFIYSDDLIEKRPHSYGWWLIRGDRTFHIYNVLQKYNRLLKMLVDVKKNNIGDSDE